MSELKLKDKKKLLRLYKRCSYAILRDWEWKFSETDLEKKSKPNSKKKLKIRSPFLSAKKKIDSKILELKSTIKK